MPKVKQVKNLGQTAAELKKTMTKRRSEGIVDAPRTFSASDINKKTGKREKVTATVGGNVFGPPMAAAKKKKKKGKKDEYGMAK